MKFWLPALGPISLAVAVAGWQPASAVSGEAVGGRKLDYIKQVQPILAEHCYKCHGPKLQKSDLRLDSVAAALEGGNSGPAIVPGKSGESLLIEAVTGGPNASIMPPEDEGPRLAAADVSTLKRWIDEGAHAPSDKLTQPIQQVKSDHWAFQPLAAPKPPSIKHTGWPRTPIDQFILARLERAGLEPAPEADRTTLIRRVSLDLTGLPPSVAEIDAFLTDTSEGAYDRVVDRLLASPHYGERWGRHWLDLARYADSNGYTIDSGRSIWKYRDWVIQSLNRDLPFDEFTIDQIAGDMLPRATADQLVATGFHRNTLLNQEGGTDPEQFRTEAVVDRVSTTASVWLGLTLGCARCHDHKYDPLSQREFYQMFALLNGADEPTLSVPTVQQAKELPANKAEIAAVEKRIEDVDSNSAIRQVEWEQKLADQIAALASSGSAPEVLDVVAPLKSALAKPAAKRSAAEKKLLLDEFRKHDPERVVLLPTLERLKKEQKELAAGITTTLVMRERKEPRPTFVHLRGDFLRPGARVQPGTPAVLPPLAPTSGPATRLGLARWLVDRRNPLTPRVSVNRIWQQYFGQGLVATENDFGTQGDRPTHPELLDWLAGQFIQRGWSMKALHRLIVSSAVYRQSSVMRAEVVSKDPYNKLLARQPRLRLEAETIRDEALAASGLLTREIGGPGVYPPQPEGIYRFTQNVKYWKESQGPDRYRRTMYTYFWRSSPYPLLTTFDAPDANTTCTRRVRSNTPLQALTLANDRGFHEIAVALGARVLKESGPGDEQRIAHAMRLCLAREPSDKEQRRLLDFVAAARKQVDGDRADGKPVDESLAWTAVARVLLNLDEFVTRE